MESNNLNFHDYCEINEVYITNTETQMSINSIDSNDSGVFIPDDITEYNNNNINVSGVLEITNSHRLEANISHDSNNLVVNNANINPENNDNYILQNIESSSNLNSTNICQQKKIIRDEFRIKYQNLDESYSESIKKIFPF